MEEKISVQNSVTTKQIHKKAVGESQVRRCAEIIGCYVDNDVYDSVEDDNCVYSRIYDCGFNVISEILTSN